ncbi:tetratricopeptide repeat protein [Chloroflexi bacterium TSY]|nr:tetratricopeptide repeat protein [Chloroflexi bacterium TSY]
MTNDTESQGGSTNHTGDQVVGQQVETIRNEKETFFDSITQLNADLIALELAKPKGKIPRWLWGTIALLLIGVIIYVTWRFGSQILGFANETLQSARGQPKWWIRISIFVAIVGIYPLAYLAYASFGAETKRERLREEFELFGLVSEQRLEETVNKLYATAYGWQQFAAYILLIVAVSFFVYLLYFQQPDLPSPTKEVALVVIYGFLGVYVFSVQELVRRYNTFDLQPQVYSSILVRFLIALPIVFILATVFFSANPPSVDGQINVALDPDIETSGLVEVPLPDDATLVLSNADAPIAGWIVIVAFAVGVFPSTGLRWLVMQANRILNPPTRQADELSLRNILGISTWHENRLSVMGIDDAQNLATADMLKLLLTTQFDTQQVANWIDQAILYVKVGDKISRFREAKITTFHEYLETLEKMGIQSERNRILNEIAEGRNEAPQNTVEQPDDPLQRAKLATVLGLADADELLRLSDHSNYPNFTHISLYYEGAARVGSQRAESSLQRLIRVGVIDRTWVSRLINPAHQKELLNELRRLLQQPRSRFNDPEYCTKLGIIYYKLQRLSKAEIIFTRSIRLDENFADAYFGRSHVYLDQEKFEQAIWDITKAIELKPHDAEIYNHRGTIYLQMKRYDRAVADLDTALELDHQMAIAYYNRAGAHNARGDHRSALLDLENAKLLGYDAYGLWHLWGLVLVTTNKYTGAVEKFSHAITRNQYSTDELIELDDMVIKSLVAEAYANRGGAYFGLGVKYIDEAEQDLNTAVRLNQELYQSFNLLGQISERRGDYNGAVEHYKRALSINQDHFAISYNLVDLLYKMQALDEARIEFRKLWQRSESNQLLHADQSRIENLAARFQASSSHLRRCKENLESYSELNDAQGKARALRQIGDLYRDRGNTQLAIENYNRAKKLYIDFKDDEQQKAVQAEIDKFTAS